jgi:predicted RNA-binding protein with PIN domain
MALMIGNANHFSNIEQINFDKARWNFRANIIEYDKFLISNAITMFFQLKWF